MKVKTIFIKSSPVKSSSRVEVATYERGKLALQFRGEDGVYSKLPHCPAKSLRDAMKQVKHIYGEVYLTTS
jgi:hypothetical protein